MGDGKAHGRGLRESIAEKRRITRLKGGPPQTARDEDGVMSRAGQWDPTRW